MKITSLIVFGFAFVFISGVVVLSFGNTVASPSSLLSETAASLLFSEGGEETSQLEPTISAITNNSDEETTMNDLGQRAVPLDALERVTEIVLFDYDGNDPAWYTVNDNVMGGVSTSLVNTDSERQRMTFSGNLSLENNGGFASIRSHYTDYDLRAYEGIALRVRGDGNIYRFRIQTVETGPEISYTAWFETKEDAWEEIYIPFSKMIPLYRGYVVNKVGPIDPESIRSFGLMLADKQQGEFVLEVDWISALSIRMNEIRYAESESEMGPAQS
jgi:monofunctional biosynthetic peptidoglycan transglycosylase